MKKEVILAITIGFILGLVITFGVWTANKSLKTLPQTDTTQTPVVKTVSTTPSPVPSGSPTTSSQLLTLTSPENELLTTEKSITVAGSTNPNSVVAILAETGEQMVTADATGKFTALVALEGGYNYLTITAVDAAGNTSTERLIVTYSTTKI